MPPVTSPTLTATDAPPRRRWTSRASRPSPLVVHRLAIASLVVNILIVITGGLVRLTGSGLGCPTWPNCNGHSLVPGGTVSWHKRIEFGNRTLTFLVAVVTIALVIAAHRARPGRRDVRRWAWLVFLGVPAQAVLGGISVLTKLNPWVVAWHFMLSVAIVAAATYLVQRTREGDAPPRLRVHPVVYRLGLGLLGVTAVVIYLGTTVTGSGPHAGDASAPRTGFDVRDVAQLHADSVWLLVGMSVVLVVLAAALDMPRAVRRAAAALLAVELAQGVVGYVQYFTGVPIGLVSLHQLGACLLTVASVAVVLSMRERGSAAAESGVPGQRWENLRVDSPIADA